MIDTTMPDTLSKQYASRASLRSNEPGWLTSRRDEAIRHFEETGFPTRNDEEWRFTNPAQIVETPFATAASTETSGADARDLISRFTFGESNLSFLNGASIAAEQAYGADGPVGLSLAQVQALPADNEHIERAAHYLTRLFGFKGQAFTALNTAFFEDGAYIFIPRNCVVDRPIEIVYVSAAGEEPLMSSPRTLIIAEENSQATIIETYIGLEDGRRLTNAVTEVVVGEGAVIDHYKRCEEPEAAFHIGSMSVRLGRSSHFSSHSITLGGGFIRNEVYADMAGEYAECTLNGLYLANDNTLVDNHTTIDHASPNCNSHEVYKGILDGRSRGVFNGKIFVRLDAQKTDAKQTNKTLLLSPDARIDTKPQLEILADDVKCTHGATIGQLDPNQVFYLRSRGMSEQEARNLLTYAFAGDIVQRIKVEPLREALDKKLLELLPR